MITKKQIITLITLSIFICTTTGCTNNRYQARQYNSRGQVVSYENEGMSNNQMLALGAVALAGVGLLALVLSGGGGGGGGLAHDIASNNARGT